MIVNEETSVDARFDVSGEDLEVGVEVVTVDPDVGAARGLAQFAQRIHQFAHVQIRQRQQVFSQSIEAGLIGLFGQIELVFGCGDEVL